MCDVPVPMLVHLLLIVQVISCLAVYVPTGCMYAPKRAAVCLKLLRMYLCCSSSIR